MFYLNVNMPCKRRTLKFFFKQKVSEKIICERILFIPHSHLDQSKCAGLWKYHAWFFQLVPFPRRQARNFRLLVLGQGLHSRVFRLWDVYFSCFFKETYVVDICRGASKEYQQHFFFSRNKKNVNFQASKS